MCSKFIKKFKLKFLMAFVFLMLSVFVCGNPVRVGNKKTVSATVGTNEAVIESLNKTNAVTKYDMSEKYPLVSENQVDTQFCWIYSSSKALETAFMVQRQEFYNVSEIGMAYLHYLERIENDPVSEPVFSVAKKFKDYVDIIQRYGLVSEASVSNDLYDEITYDNYQTFSYVTDYVDSETAKQVEPVDIKNSLYFSNLGKDTEKVNIIKNFVAEYGGVQIGIDEGVLYKNNGKNYFTGDVNKQADIMSVVGDPHAVCIIGWDDSAVVDGGDPGAFIAMNSWGLESTAFETFYVAYDYVLEVSPLYGFILNDDDVVVEMKESSVNNFARDIYIDSDLNNMFTYDETIVAAEYKLNVSSLDEISVTITNGRADYKSWFDIVPNNQNKTISIILNNKSSFYGGYYSIKFYKADDIICEKTIYVYSGTEIGYFKLTAKNRPNVVNLNGAFLSNASNTTFYVSSDFDYKINFSLTPMNEYKRFSKQFSFTIVNAKATSTNNSTVNAMGHNDIINYIVAHSSYSYNNSNLFEIELNDLDVFENCKLTFTIRATSIVYQNVTRDYKVSLFISSRSAEELVDYYIDYITDGGINHIDNISHLPDYIVDDGMPRVELNAPTKDGYEFLGWYLNPEFTGSSVTSISKSVAYTNINNGVLSVYAKWKANEADYFEIEADIVGVTPYGGEETSEIPDHLVYGDSVRFELKFTELLDLSKTNYTIEYYFYINGGEAKVSGDLQMGSQSVFVNISYLDLQSGEYSFRFKVKINVNNIHREEKTAEINKVIDKKLVGFEFDKLEYTYDGEYHSPKISPIAGGFYSHDLEGVTLESLFTVSNSAKKEAGEYEIRVIGINNSNYYFDAEQAKCLLKINKRKIYLTWNNFDATYNKKEHIPTFNLHGVVPGDSVEFALTDSEFVNAGTYKINVLPETISNNNYEIEMGEDFVYTIKKAVVNVVIHNASDRLQTKPDQRFVPTYDVYGSVFEDNYGVKDDLGVVLQNDADQATKSGKYVVGCTLTNANYEAEVTTGIYTLTGYYRIYYYLPDGSVHIEVVEEGQKPKGITKDETELSLFDKVVYSQSISNLSTDVHVTVEIKNYTSQVLIISFAVGFVAIVLFVYYKKRKNFAR